MRPGLTTVRALLLGLIVAPMAQGQAPVPAGLAPLSDDLIGTRVAPILLLSRPDVRADLALTPAQVRESEALSVELHARALALKGKAGPRYAAERKAIDEAQRAWFEGRLSAAQLNRLFQIDLQWEGRAALVTRPLVGHHLGLSSQQVATLKEAVAARDAARLKGESPGGAEQALAGRIDPLLTPDQKLVWREMQGAPFVPQVTARTGGRPAAVR
jgi:hypothetical protein